MNFVKRWNLDFDMTLASVSPSFFFYPGSRLRTWNCRCASSRLAFPFLSNSTRHGETRNVFRSKLTILHFKRFTLAAVRRAPHYTRTISIWINSQVRTNSWASRKRLEWGKFFLFLASLNKALSRLAMALMLQILCARVFTIRTHSTVWLTTGFRMLSARLGKIIFFLLFPFFFFFLLIEKSQQTMAIVEEGNSPGDLFIPLSFPWDMRKNFRHCFEFQL